MAHELSCKFGCVNMGICSLKGLGNEGEDRTVVKHVKFLSALMSAAFIFGMTQTAQAQSTAENDQGVANNLVTQSTASAASAQVAGLVGTAVSTVVAPPPAPPGAPSTPTTTSDAGSSTIYFNSRQTGASAGNAPKAGVWVQGGFTSVDGDDTGGEFDGEVINLLVGADYKLNPKMVVGVALGYEDLDIDTTFNNGTFKGEGFGVTPYLGMAFTPQWSIQVLGGWTTVEYDTTRNNGAITSSFDAERIFGSAAIVGNFKLSKKVVVAPKLSILHLAEDQDGTTDSAGNVTTGETIDLGRISFGGTLSYLAGSVTPFVRIMGEYDYAKEDAANLGNGNFSSDDEYGINASVGLNLDFGNGVNGNVEATSATLLRDNLDVYTVSGRIRYTW